MFAVEQSLSAVLIVPTLNPDCRWSEWLAAYNKQTCKFDVDCLVIDSGSGIDFIDFTIAAGCKVVSIDKIEFNHGGTRQFGVELSGNAEFVVFCTQDAIFSHEDALKNLLSCFANEQVGAVYDEHFSVHTAKYGLWLQPVLFVEDFYLYALLFEVEEHVGGHLVAAVVQDHFHLHAAFGGIGEGLEFAVSDGIALDDVGGEEYFLLGCAEQLIAGVEGAVLIVEDAVEVALCVREGQREGGPAEQGTEDRTCVHDVGGDG